MAFVSAQNKLVFSGSQTQLTYNLALLRLVYKTLNEAVLKEATLRGRANPYWVVDPSRSSSGNHPLEEGGSDHSIFQYGYNLTSNDKGNYGLFLKSIDNEYLFLSTSRQLDPINSYASSTYSLAIGSIYPSSINSNYSYYTDNSHVYANKGNTDSGSNPSQFYGLSASLSKSDFGSNDPKNTGFFSNTDLKMVSDSILGNTSQSTAHYLPSTGDTLEIICAVDGKNILIYKKESWSLQNNKYPETLLLIGDFIVPDDSSDTNVTTIFALQGYATYSNMSCMFADKSGSTALNANGVSLAQTRIPRISVSDYLLPSGVIDKIAYSPFHFYWDSQDTTSVNTDLNSNGKGYKGQSNTDMVRVVGKTNLITVRDRYNNEWMPLIAWNNIIVMVKWDPSNDDLEM